MARKRRCCAVAALALLLAPGLAWAQRADRPSRATSASGQFVVYSSNAEWRTAASRRADDTLRAWEKWLGTGVGRGTPIIVQDVRTAARPPGNPRAVTAIFEGDGGAVKVQTDIYDASVMAGESYEREIFQALGLERIYRGQIIRAGKAFRQIPAWMSEGMAEEIRVERNGTPDGVYAALLRSERPPRIEDFLKAKPELMEATSLALYRTQALALLRALRQLPEGGDGLVTLVTSLEKEDGGLKAILAAFPSLSNDAAQLSKVWTLSIARGSTSKKLDLLSIPETSRELDTILDVSTPVDVKKPGDGMVSGAAALPGIARGPGGQFLMRQKAAELLNLEFRAHPVMRPLIAEYRGIATALAERPRRKVEKQIEENDKIRALLEQRTGNVEDYLNWFEATQLDVLSDGVLEISDPPSAEPRTDPITRHLDAIERRGW